MFFVARTLTFIFLFLSLAGEAESANRIADACALLTQNDHELTTKCINHAELFELDSGFIKAVAAFDRSIDIRMRALKSGANTDTLELCKKLRWTTENTLSCLRSYPTPELIKGCKKISSSEEDQLRCIRLGKEPAQVNACDSIASQVKEKFRCLEMDVPALATLNCRNKSDSEKIRQNCLQQLVHAREEEYRRDQNEMKREAKASLLDPAYGNPEKVPSFVRRRPASGPNSK